MTSKKSTNSIFLLLAIICITGFASESHAKCGGTVLKPSGEIAWNNIFPIKIASIPIGSPGNNHMKEPPDPARLPVCICPAPYPEYYRYGISLAYWEPARFVETVSQAWCMPCIGGGKGSSDSSGGSSGKSKKFLEGTKLSSGNNEPQTFAQAHYFTLAYWEIIEYIVDDTCQDSSGSAGIDLAYMTELDAMWQDDEMAFAIQPEAMAFANPIAQFSCIADAVGAMVGVPLPPLFHCVGSGGSIYPISGAVNDEQMVQAHQTIGSRMIFKLCRQFMIWDPAVWLCSSVVTPIWIKYNYRLQVAKPVSKMFAQPPGRTSMLWGSGANPPFGKNTDNFLFIIFRKRTCCVSD